MVQFCLYLNREERLWDFLAHALIIAVYANDYEPNKLFYQAISVKLSTDTRNAGIYTKNKLAAALGIKLEINVLNFSTRHKQAFLVRK